MSSVVEQTPFTEHVGNGVATVFGYEFHLLSAADLIATIDGDVVPASGYSVAGIGQQGGGDVTFSAAPASGASVLLRREIALERDTDYQYAGDFREAVVDRDFNRLWQALQDMRAIVNGAYRFVYPNVAGPLPAPVPTMRDRLLTHHPDTGQPMPSAFTHTQVASVVAAAYAQQPATMADTVVYWPAGVDVVARSVQSVLRERVSLMDFGAACDGVTPDDDAVDAAIAHFGSGMGEIFQPPGQLLLTRPHVVDQDRIHWVGAGSWVSRIKYAPTANGICLKFTKGGSQLTHGGIRGVSFYSVDSTYTKTALEIEDVSAYAVDDIVIGGGVEAVPGTMFWSGGAGSIGLRLRGRETTRIRGITIFADRPVLISGNPNNTIDNDHFHFTDTYLGATTGWPKVEVEDGANVTNLTFDGYNAWVLGAEGLKWIDTTSSEISSHLVIKGLRNEQGLSATAYVLDIQHNTDLQSVSIEDSQGGLECNGYRFRKVRNLSIKNNINAGGSGRTHLNVDATVVGIKFDNCFWQAGGSAVMTGQRLVWAAPTNPNTAPLPPSAIYDSTSNAAATTASECAIGGATLTIANDGVVTLGDANMCGLLYVTDSEGLSAVFNLRGHANVASEVSDPASVFTITENNASTSNVYYHAGSDTYRIQNKRGAERRYRVQLIGSYEPF